MTSHGLVSFYWRMVLRPHLKWAAMIFLMMVASSFMGMATVGLTVPLVDVLTAPSRPPEPGVVATLIGWLARLRIPTGSGVTVFILLAVACLAFLLHSALQLLQEYSTALIATKFRQETKTALFERFLRAPFEEVSRQARGSIVHHINDPSQSVFTAMVNIGFFVSGIIDCALMIGLIVYLSWWATLLAGAVGLGGILGWRRLTSRQAMAFGKALYEVRRDQAKLETDAIDGLRVVKAYYLEQQMVQRQRALLAAEESPVRHLTFFRYGPNFVNEGIAVSLTLWLGVIACFFPSWGLRFSVLVAFLLALRKMTPAMARITSSTVELYRLRGSLETMEDVLQHLPQERLGGRSLGRVEHVTLLNVSFRYQSRPERLVLNGVTMTIPRGVVTAVVGPTGAGKSTLAHLLLGLYEPLSGAVAINGTDLRTADLSVWRRNVGYVSQDIFVFNDSIRNNITLGEPASQVALDEVAAIAQLQAFIETLPHGYETIVGDRGIRLSGGQCQRLAIARAIFRRPQVLIFDEATSALDNLTERAVYDAISALNEDAAILLIAHRLSTVKAAGQIIVLQSGAVVEQGTHDELVAQRGVYARLYEEDGRPRTHLTPPLETATHVA